MRCNRFLVGFLSAVAFTWLTAGSIRPSAPKDEPRQTANVPCIQDLALTPPMGWNSWNPFGKNVSEAIIRETADAMVTSGLKDVGFSYIVVDDLWQGGRDSKGMLFPDPK